MLGIRQTTLNHGLICNFCPILKISRVVLQWVRSIKYFSVVGQVLPKVVNPARSSGLCEHVLLYDRFDPSSRSVVRKVNHSELFVISFLNVSLALRISDKKIVCKSIRVKIVTQCVFQVRTHVQKCLDTV